MAEEEKPKQLVQMSTVVASGMTAIIAALFTSRLGVTGTLIGTALTPMLMTVGVAVLNAQIQKATGRISDLPSTVRGRLSTQRVRVPEAPGPEAPPEDPEPPAASRRRDRRTPGIFERLLSIPTDLREMSPSTRRRTLLTGALAGLVAVAIGLAGVTAIEAASGGPLSCTLYDDDCAGTGASGEVAGGSGNSISRAFGGVTGTEPQDVPTGGEGPSAEDQQLPAGGQQPEEQPAPGVQQMPQEGQYGGTPQEGGGQPSADTPVPPPAEQTPQEPEQPAVPVPDAAPQDSPQQPSAAPDAGQQPVLPEEQ